VPLVWTTDPPTEPGWYWVRNTSDTTMSPYYFDSEEFWNGNDTYEPRWFTHFAGPIPEPQEEE
jgi:hypothetical protein